MLKELIEIFRKRVCVLQITPFAGFAIGAEHFYGKLSLDGEEFELRKKLSAKDAKLLNVKNGLDGSSRYHPGMLVNMFNEKEFIIELAKLEYKARFPLALALVRGTTACLDPQEILDGPAAFMKNGTVLYNLALKCKGWENEKKMNEICSKWEKLLSKLEMLR